MYIKHPHPVAHPVNIQIFQYDMVIYLGNLEMNFIGTEAIKRSDETSVSWKSVLLRPPKLNHVFTSLHVNIPMVVEAK